MEFWILIVSAIGAWAIFWAIYTKGRRDGHVEGFVEGVDYGVDRAESELHGLLTKWQKERYTGNSEDA